MNEDGDIVAVSVPFASGIAAGTLATGFLNEGTAWYAASALIILCGVLWYVSLIGRNGFIRTVLMFFAAGLFCSLSHEMCMHGGTGSGWLSGITSGCAESFRETIMRTAFPHESTNALVCAFLTGDRGGLTTAQTEIFRDSGASHILALSGLHLGVIYMIVCRLLSFTGNSIIARSVRSVTVIMLSGFYALMTGAGPSIVRALLFIILNEAGKMLAERKRAPVRTLLVALTLQLCLNPAVITSIGFQLSYLAMTGISVIFPRMSSWYPRNGKFDPFKWIWDSAAMAVACQILTAPLVWMRFRTFPRYFIITNLLAMPLTSAIMAASVTAVALGSLDICPGILLKACDAAVQALFFILECISGMQTAK